MQQPRDLPEFTRFGSRPNPTPAPASQPGAAFPSIALGPLAGPAWEGERASHIAGLILSAPSEELDRVPEGARLSGAKLVQGCEGLLQSQNLGASLLTWSSWGQTVGGQLG